MSSNIFTPSKVTLAAAIQALVLPRLFKDFLSTTSQLKLILSIFGINYAALLFHFFIIYPFLLSKVRHLPGPRVRRISLRHDNLVASLNADPATVSPHGAPTEHGWPPSTPW